MNLIQIIYMGYRVEFELKVLPENTQDAVDHLKSLLALDGVGLDYSIRAVAEENDITKY